MAQASHGRRAIPPQLKLLTGRGDGKDTAGRPIPKPPPFTRRSPDKPDELSADASWMWDLVVEQWHTLNMLKPLDGPALEVGCETYARWKESVRWRRKKQLLAANSQGVIPGPWIGIEERASREFRAWCNEFGLTPAAENKVGMVGAASDDNVNPFD